MGAWIITMPLSLSCLLEWMILKCLYKTFVLLFSQSDFEGYYNSSPDTRDMRSVIKKMHVMYQRIVNPLVHATV